MHQICTQADLLIHANKFVLDMRHAALFRNEDGSETTGVENGAFFDHTMN